VTSVLPSAQAASGAIRAICVAAFQESKLLDLVNEMLVDALEYMAQMAFRLAAKQNETYRAARLPSGVG